jgi:hypothetical protein
MIAVSLLVFSVARHHNAASAASARSSTPQSGIATPAARGRIQAAYAALPLAFEQNKGQTDGQVKYMARANAYTLFLTANDAVFSLRSRSAEGRRSTGRGDQLRAKNLPQRNTQKDSTAVVHMQLAGGNSLAKVAASGLLPGKANYFVGNDSTKWQSDIARYSRVSYANVYPGVNLAFHGVQRQLEFDFVVAPNANPAPIAFHFTGAKQINTDDSGNLVVSSVAGNVLLHKPVAYQEQNGTRQNVDAQFVLKANNQVSFELGNYDHNRELVIDPSVSYGYSTYLGGSGEDEGYGIAFDSNGNAYVTGQTASQNFPGTSGGFTGTAQVFVTKISADGSSLVYSTYIGGSGANGDSGNAIAVDSSGDAFVTGGTTSANFPTTTGAFQTTLKGTGDAFVLELGASGSITYSTYLGGTGDSVALGIALASDNSGDVFVVGKTSSDVFPTSSTPLQPFVTGSTGSGFVTKLNSSGTALVYSTYLGGSSTGNGDVAKSVAVDSSDNAYVTGQTFSSTFHVTSGAYQTTCGSCSGGDSNAFVTVINAAANDYIYSTFLGGSGFDIGDGVAVDSAGSAYATGTTTSADFPTTAGTVQPSYNGDTDAFITKLNPAGTALVYSTFLGGSGFDAGASIALDGNKNAYITGQTNSSAFPTAIPTQAAPGGDNDAFVSELNSTGSQLIFSTYLGGSADEDDGGDYGAIAVDSAGANIYVTGNSVSTTFPTQAAFQADNGGAGDAFVVKYTQGTSPTFSLSANPTDLTVSSPGGSASTTVTVTPAAGFSGPVTLICSVSSGPAGAVDPPTCAAATASPAVPGTLAVNTTPGTTGFRRRPSLHSSRLFYAMFLPVGGIALLGFGSADRRRRKLFGFLLLGLLVSSLIVLPACGGGGNSGGGGGSSGTTPGSYTITVTGTATGAAQTGASPSLTLTVN